MKKIIYIILFLCLPLNLFGADDQLSRTLYNAVHFAENENNKKAFPSVVVDLNTIKSALAKGANPNWINIEKRHNSVLGNFVWYISVGKNTDVLEKGIEAIEILFKNNAKLQYCDRGILFWPIAEGKYDIVKILLEKGASATFWPEDEIGSKLTPIEYALSHGHYKIADLLVKYGANKVNQKEVIQMQFIEMARFGSVSELDKLIKNGANVNGKNASGETALINVLFMNINYETYIKVNYLLDNGADVNLKGKGVFGITTPLNQSIYFTSLSFKYNKETEYAKKILKVLIEKGAFISGKDEDDRTPLHIAAEYNNLYAANLLLESGSKVMPKDKFRKTPLDYAQSREMIQLLKKYGAVEQ